MILGTSWMITGLVIIGVSIPLVRGRIRRKPTVWGPAGSIVPVGRCVVCDQSLRGEAFDRMVRAIGFRWRRLLFPPVSTPSRDRAGNWVCAVHLRRHAGG